MSPEDFNELRRAPKTIDAGIEYERYEQDAEIWVFADVEVNNYLGHSVFLNGAYDPRTGYIKFNFTLRSIARESFKSGLTLET